MNIISMTIEIIELPLIPLLVRLITRSPDINTNYLLLL